MQSKSPEGALGKLPVLVLLFAAFCYYDDVT